MDTILEGRKADNFVMVMSHGLASLLPYSTDASARYNAFLTWLKVFEEE